MSMKPGREKSAVAVVAVVMATGAEAVGAATVEAVVEAVQGASLAGK